jgi:hypothetical protein
MSAVRHCSATVRRFISTVRHYTVAVRRFIGAVRDCTATVTRFIGAVRHCTATVGKCTNEVSRCTVPVRVYKCRLAFFSFRAGYKQKRVAKKILGATLERDRVYPTCFSVLF